MKISQIKERSKGVKHLPKGYKLFDNERVNGIIMSSGVDKAGGVYQSFGVFNALCIYGSCGVYKSNGLNGSTGICESNGIYESNGVYNSMYILECCGISNSLFCYKKSGNLYLFNKEITEKRFEEVFDKLTSFKWYPELIFAKKLADYNEELALGMPPIWTPPIEEVNNKTAFSFMPKEMINYIKSLPEFDKKIFNIITGDIKEISNR